MSCPLCKNTGARDFPIYYTFQEQEYHARECSSCSFIYLEPRLTREELAVLYRDEYFLHDGADCGAHSPTDYEAAAIKGSVKFPEIIGWIKKFKPTGDFFEVGCGMGYFLNYARQHGFRVSGIEYADLGTRICREKFRLDVQRTAFEDYTLQDSRYDVVFMGDVLEHLPDPRAMLEKTNQMLRPTGIVAVEVPSMFNSIVGRLAITGYRILHTRKKMPMPPYHVNEFTPRTLKTMMVRAGFTQTHIIQRIKPPSAITLRGSLFEKAVKRGLQYPNYVLTKTAGVLGDRLLGIGIKPA
jgi:2-polyprenyl-3-methyl-5-hydroxy-6-metoxy-1,4-benzoquinol methylase